MMETTLTTLPREILDRICYYVDQETRQQLRLTCLTFAHVGKPWAFEKVVILPNAESYARLDNILANPDVCRVVSKIYLDIRQWHPYHDMEIDDDDYETEERAPYNGKEESHCLPEETLRMFTHLLKQSARLYSVVVRFHRQFYVELCSWIDERHHWRFRHNVIKQVMSALLSAPDRLPRELAIQNLHNINVEDPDAAEMIARVLGGGLQSLRLNITNEHRESNGEVDFQTQEPHIFYPEISSIWVKPTASSLRHLTLYSSLYFGYYPKFDLRGVHLPHLRTLSFGNHCFVHDSQLDWILSHGPTLTELYLDDCPILFQVSIKEDAKEKTYLDAQMYELKSNEANRRYSATYSRRWSDYFKAFERDLPHLRHFRYGMSPAWMEEESTPFECETEIGIQMGEGSYMVFCDGFGPSPYMERMIHVRPLPGNKIEWEHGEGIRASEEDKTALRDLYAKLGQVVYLI